MRTDFLALARSLDLRDNDQDLLRFVERVLDACKAADAEAIRALLALDDEALRHRLTSILAAYDGQPRD